VCAKSCDQRQKIAVNFGPRLIQVDRPDAYGRACAVTQEHSLPALEASHIQPYAKDGPHDVRNGVLLRADLHRLRKGPKAVSAMTWTVSRLPRRAPRVVSIAAALVVLLGASASATDFLVGTDAQLRSAITSAGNGDRIIFTASINLASDLPALQTNITIVGNNFTLSGTLPGQGDQFRGLFVGAWALGTATQVPVTVRIQDLVIQHCRATGGGSDYQGGGGAGLGGALFVANSRLSGHRKSELL
jgi:hypothetical protein